MMMMKTILSAVAVATLGLGTAAQAGDGTSEHSGRREIQARQQQRVNERQANNAPQYQQRQATRQYSQAYPQAYAQPRTQAYAQQQYTQAYNQPRYDRRYDRATYTAPRYEQRSYAYNAPVYSSYNSYGYPAQQYRSYNTAPRYWTGGYVPASYRAQRYWVNDWRARHLSAPPYGYQWVETDTGDVLLRALASGLIASVILSQY